MTQLSLSSLDDTVELQGTLERVVFHNEENGYTVFRVRPEGKDEVDLVTVVGHMGSPQAGASLRIKGRWVNNAALSDEEALDRVLDLKVICSPPPPRASSCIWPPG